MKCEKKSWLKRIVAIVFAYGFVLSLQRIIAMWNISVDYYGVAIYGSSIFVVGLFVFSACAILRLMQRTDRRLHVISGAVGLSLSIAIVYGSYVHFENDIFQSAEIALLQIGLIIGFFLFSTAVVEEIMVIIIRFSESGG